ncbi:MAG: hypothetical protein IJI54_02705 [Kiritimatiellae bacterium]|nr:hypothetical protein [Kiritimatiellia bacterium]
MKTQIGIALALFVGSLYAGGTARIGVKVVDSETEEPIPKIKVHGGFRNYSRGWGIASKDNADDGVTGHDGFCRLSGRTEAGHACCVVRNNAGYYDSGWYSFDYTEQSMLKLGRWLPDDVVITVRLDRVINPIPLSVAFSRPLRTEEDEMSFAEGENVALYDLLKNDWLPPLGKGEVADISFSSKRTNLGSEPYNYPSGIRTNEFYRYDVQVRFIGDGNGMKESNPPKEAGIKLRTAPETGYEPMRVCWTGRMSRTEYKDNSSDERCYFFRIRTELDELGKIKSAIYGKIYGDFKIVGKKNGIKGVSFLYYLNPNLNDRNLEWDRQHNLCPNTKDIGEPRP